jgi:riboflavin synthase
MPKGFIGLDGCSLTIGNVVNDTFNVHLIPETLHTTLFGTRKVGDRINVEIDSQTQTIVDTVERVLATRVADSLQ